MQSQPTIFLLAPSSGPTAGGTTVTVAGTDFTGATAVRFGGVPASSFTVESENKLTAVAPPASPGVVDVSVTTIAGTSPATGADRFEYTTPRAPPAAPPLQCSVPKLKGKKLKAAKTALTRAHCKLGHVAKEKGVTAKTGKVVKQKPKPETVKPEGFKVTVKLGG